MNYPKVAVALRALADAFEEGGQDAQPPAGTTEAAAKPRGRGRPVKGEETTAAVQGAATTPTAQTTAAAVTASDDPFSAPAPTATLDEVRKALTALKDASSQEKALKVLKDAGGANNLGELTAAKYGDVVAAANKEVAEVAKPAAQPEADDPFAIPSTAAAPAEKPVSIEEVKAAVVEAQKHTAADVVQKLVMEQGGKAKNPDTGIEGPSLKALPISKYAETIKALKALPKTK